MEKDNIKFITGGTYTLAELFSGNRRIIIPDLQRDYCWGDPINKKSSGEVGELVTDFVNNLIEQYNPEEQSTLNIGLFYGYEIPANHIQLCDGQQRLTTLFLLLGMINKRAGKFRQYLISDFEYNHDDKEPYLNYAIRESSLYFLSDLVCRFFIENDDNVDCIKETEWYFSDYDLDPSICSMINALNKIEAILKEKETKWVEAFGEWLLYSLTFLYIDMKNRKNGEETFVVINTTGEPLSVTQNLKPFIINADINKNETSVDSKWEEIETWFWRNRQGDNDTADAGFAEFLRWVYIIEMKDVPSQSNESEYLMQSILQGKGKCDFPYKEIAFEKILKYWEALVWVMDDNKLFSFNRSYLSPKTNKYVNNRKAINQSDCFVLLPILKYVYSHLESIETSEDVQLNTKRLYEFFVNLIRTNDVSKNVNQLVREALRVVDVLPTDDIVSVLQCRDVVSLKILTEEEECKLHIFRSSNCRDEVERLFWKIQKHRIWSGEISPIIKWATDENGTFLFEKFSQYVALLGELFPADARHDKITDLLRRCMIVNQEHYKPVYRGAYATFGWEWEDWRKLLCRENGRIVLLFEYILNKQKDDKSLEDTLSDYINEYATDKDYVEFAISSYLLSFTHLSEACDMFRAQNDWQISVAGGTGRHTSFFSRRNAYILQAFGGKHKNTYDNKRTLQSNGWSIWYWPESHRNNCVVFESPNGVKLDTRFFSSENGGGKLEITLKATSNKQNLSAYPRVLNAFQLQMNEKQEVVISEMLDAFDVEQIKSKVEKLIATIDLSFS